MNRSVSAAFRTILDILSSIVRLFLNMIAPVVQANDTRLGGRHQGFGGEWSEVGGERSGEVTIFYKPQHMIVSADGVGAYSQLVAGCRAGLDRLFGRVSL
jgi:hypothetical protein